MTRNGSPLLAINMCMCVCLCTMLRRVGVPSGPQLDTEEGGPAERVDEHYNQRHPHGLGHGRWHLPSTGSGGFGRGASDSRGRCRVRQHVNSQKNKITIIISITNNFATYSVWSVYKMSKNCETEILKSLKTTPENVCESPEGRAVKLWISQRGDPRGAMGRCW